MKPQVGTRHGVFARELSPRSALLALGVPMLPSRGQRVCRAQYPVGSRRAAPGQTPLTPAALAAPRLPRGAGEGSGVRGPWPAASVYEGLCGSGC